MECELAWANGKLKEKKKKHNETWGPPGLRVKMVQEAAEK